MLIAAAAFVADLACAPFERVGWRGGTRLVMRCEGERAVVDFDHDGLEQHEREAFAQLVDRGIADLERLLGPGLTPLPGVKERIRYVVSARIEISRTFGRTVLLPLARVQVRRAPYLHETVHALLPTRHRSTWLSEGLACFLESWVAENVGGYDAHVFSRAGDRGIHEAAARYLRSEPGRAVLPWVGATGEPPRLLEERTRVARPFYVLAHSFTKHLVERLGLAAVARLAEGTDPEAGLESLSGQPVGEWRLEWLACLASSFRVASIRGGCDP